MALLDTLLAPLENLFNRIFGGTVVAKLVHKVADGVRHVTTLLQRIDTLVSSIKSEIVAFRHWKEDFHFKSKVISLPLAVQRTRDFASQLRQSWDALIALAKDLRDTVRGGGDPAQEAEEVAADLGDLSNVGESLLKKLPKLSRGLEKLLGVVTLIVDAVIQWSDAIDRLQQIVDAVTALREEIETGATIFLSQSNKRKTLELASGGKIKIRVGNLHS